MKRYTVDTPWGRISYKGNLSENTLLTMPNGKQIPFYSFISHTQGDCLAYFSSDAMAKSDTVTPKFSIEEIED